MYKTRVHARITNVDPCEGNRSVSDKSARILVRVRLVDDPRAEVGEDVRVCVGVSPCRRLGMPAYTDERFHLGDGVVSGGPTSDWGPPGPS